MQTDAQKGASLAVHGSISAALLCHDGIHDNTNDEIYHLTGTQGRKQVTNRSKPACPGMRMQRYSAVRMSSNAMIHSLIPTIQDPATSPLPPKSAKKSQQIGEQSGGPIFRQNGFPVPWISVPGPKHTFRLVAQ